MRFRGLKSKHSRPIKVTGFWNVAKTTAVKN